MKKLVLLASVAFIVASMTSCKKDYTCTCTYSGQTYVYQLGKVKKSDAKGACDAIGAQWITFGGSCTAAQK